VKKDSKIYVAGHRGLLGSALVRRLRSGGYTHLILRPRENLDLTKGGAVERFFREERPEYVFLAAARVGGIGANKTFPADFIRENLLIQISVLNAAHAAGVRRLLFFGSTCLYPRECPQPMREEHLGSGPMEPTSIAYSAAKLAGWVMCDAYNRQYGTEFLTVVPATLYGPGDDFGVETGHVLSALLRRFHDRRREASVTMWGTGWAIREFLYSDDLAEACVFLMERPGPPARSPINVGSGDALTIRELAAMIGEVVGFRGEVLFDASKPDGAPAKVLDSSHIRQLGWAPRTALRDGLRKSYEWYLTQS